MATNQGSRQSAYRDIGGTTGTIAEDQRAAFEDEATVPTGASHNGAWIAWLQDRLSSSNGNINGLLYAWAADNSVANYCSLTTFNSAGPDVPTALGVGTTALGLSTTALGLEP